MTLHEDAGHLSIGIEDRLINEIEKALLPNIPGGLPQVNTDASPNERLTAVINPVEKIDEALPYHLRQRVPDGLPDDVLTTDQLEIGRIGHGEDVIGPAEGGYEAGRLLEQSSQVLSLLTQSLIGFLHGLRAAEHIRLDQRGGTGRQDRAPRQVPQPM